MNAIPHYVLKVLNAAVILLDGFILVRHWRIIRNDGLLLFCWHGVVRGELYVS